MIDNPLIKALSDPESMTGFAEADWDQVIRMARASGLLSTLSTLASHTPLTASPPARVMAHLAAASAVARQHQAQTRWEVEAIHGLLLRAGIPVVVLKGAAYVMAGLDAAQGRIFGDVDILVPRGALADAERILDRAGWQQENKSRYDDRYYRRWMHEVPPRRHHSRGTVIDMHHSLLPLTARHRPDVSALWAQARTVEGYADLYVLAPEDMVLHSASHLFLNGEFDRGLRDLYDFVRLGRQFGQAPDFWARLATRAAQLDLIEPLHDATRYANRLLGAGFPAPGIERVRPFMDALFERGLQPNHRLARDRWTAWALFCLYVRGHYLRMPFRLLLPHLLYKATLGKFSEIKAVEQEQATLRAFKDFLVK
ncbi:MAG: nucleotidyltransferase domain-containing protein [Pseudomonadota bacterium]